MESRNSASLFWFGVVCLVSSCRFIVTVPPAGTVPMSLREKSLMLVVVPVAGSVTSNVARRVHPQAACADLITRGVAPVFLIFTDHGTSTPNCRIPKS